MNGPKNPAFIHFRRPKYKMQFTVCLSYIDGTTNSGVSFAFCSDKDNFSKKIGRSISQGRISRIKNIICISNEIIKRYKGTYDCLKAIVDAFSKEIDITKKGVNHELIKKVFYNVIVKLKLNMK